KERTRCPTLILPASGPCTYPVSIFPAWAVFPAVRTHVCIGRTAVLVSVSVRSTACFSLTAVLGAGFVWLRTPWAFAEVTASKAVRRRLDMPFDIVDFMPDCSGGHRPPLQQDCPLVAVVILAIHNVRAPGKETHIGDFFELFRLCIDDYDRMSGRFREINLLLRGIRSCRFQLNIGADLDPAGRLQCLHVIDIDETAGRADHKSFAGGIVHPGHVRTSFESRSDFLRIEIDD